MDKLNILIPDVVKPPAKIEEEVFGPDADIFVGQAKKAGEIPDSVWKNCNAILAWEKLQYDKQLLAKLDKCKVIVRVGVGFDNIDLAEAKRKGIIVCNVPDYGTEEVADQTMVLLLSLIRGLFEFTNQAKERDWSRCNPVPIRLRNKVLGIIGLGRIGTAVAQRAKSFGIAVIFYDPYIKDGIDKALGVERVDRLDDLAKRSDIISLHAPLTEETEGMINNEFFANAKKGSILINTARGAIVDISALEIAMKKGVIRSAGLDVLPIEPSDDSQNLIVEWENDREWLRGRLIVTPHISFYSSEGYIEMRKKAAQEALRVLRGEKARNCVNQCL